MLASATLEYSCQGLTCPPVGWHQSQVPSGLQPAVLGPGPAHHWLALALGLHSSQSYKWAGRHHVRNVLTASLGRG